MPQAVTVPQGLDPVRLFAPVAGQGAIGIAVSGGADSLALMLLVAAWRQAAPDAPPAIVYSVDHGLRPEAAGEVEMVCRTAERFGLAARGLRWAGDKPASGLQAAARSARYRLIAGAMAVDGAAVCLTAHHQRDQAETVLMRLAHGSGVEGLSGMAKFSVVEGCPLFRPLLGVSPLHLRALVEDNGLVPAEDPSNQDHAYERVRWRMMLPQLEYLGLGEERLSTFARRMGELDALVDQEVERHWPALVTRSAAGIAIRRDGLAALAGPVAVRLLGRALALVGGGQKPHALGQVERLHAQIATTPALKRTSLHACLIESDGSSVTIVPEPGRTRQSGSGQSAAP